MNDKPALALPPDQPTIEAEGFHPAGAFDEFSEKEVEQSIPDCFEKIVRKQPGHLAVAFKDLLLTYDDLNKAANRVAHAIASRRGARHEAAVLLLDQDVQYLIALLGLLKAGKFCVHVDPSHPAERQRAILSDAQAQLILTNNEHASLGDTIAPPGSALLNVEALSSDLPDENLDLSLSPESIANIFYTSGSTGSPKGVIQTHRYVLHKVFLDKLFISHEDRLAQVGRVSGEVFNVLLNGAAFFWWNVKEEGFFRLADWLTECRITVYRSVPTVFRHFCTQLAENTPLATVRKIILGGEPVYKRDAELFKSHFSSGCVLVNKYGGAEAGPISWYVVDKETEVTGNIVPAGYSFPGKEIILSRDTASGTEADHVGEIMVKSRYLSPGYLGRPDLTEAAFFDDLDQEDKRVYRTGDLGSVLPDGCLIYRGRKDSRVKVRGNSVETAEVEAAVFEHKAVKEAVVTAIANESGDTRLIAYIAPAQNPPPSAAEVRDFLKQKLPDYMVPSAFVILDRLPTLPGGKIDRKALPIPDLSRRRLDNAYVSPRTPVEADLAKIWSEVLGIDRIGMHDSFLDLGGHSLAATRVVSRVIERFQLELPVKTLFDSPTVSHMAAVITHNQTKKAQPENLARMLRELEELSDEDARRLLESEKKPAT
ncbi:MAG: non-ribosomal peptide synthetase [Candidatus Binatia bacterium]